jgi:CBS-domain-containing membrane protein
MYTAQGDSTQDSSRKSPDLVPVSEIMSRDVFAVKADLLVDDFEEILIDKGISGAPVVDERGKPIGIVSKTDLLHRKRTPSFENLKVKDVMMRTAYCLADNEPIARAAGLMSYEAVHRLPVVDANGMVIGVVSPLDIMRWLARQHGYPIGNRP